MPGTRRLKVHGIFCTSVVWKERNDLTICKNRVDGVVRHGCQHNLPIWRFKQLIGWSILATHLDPYESNENVFFEPHSSYKEAIDHEHKQIYESPPPSKSDPPEPQLKTLFDAKCYFSLLFLFGFAGAVASGHSLFQTCSHASSDPFRHLLESLLCSIQLFGLLDHPSKSEAAQFVNRNTLS